MKLPVQATPVYRSSSTTQGTGVSGGIQPMSSVESSINSEELKKMLLSSVRPPQRVCPFVGPCFWV